MKKEISINVVFLVLIIGLLIIMCIPSSLLLPSNRVSSVETTSPYILVYTDTYFNCEIVYDKDTKVMYSISNGIYNRGIPTVLLNADGTPKIWEGDE